MKTVVFTIERTYPEGNCLFEIVVTRASRLDAQVEVWYRVKDRKGSYLGAGWFSRAEGYSDGFIYFNDLRLRGRLISDVWIDSYDVRCKIDALLKSASPVNTLPILRPKKVA